MVRTEKGQPVIMSTSPFPAPVPSALSDALDNEMDVFKQVPSILLFQPFQLGPVIAKPHLNYSLTYANGVQSSPGNPQSTLVQSLSPGVLFVLGTHWTLDYTPTLTFYSDKNLNDSVSHSLSLSWGTTYNEWVFSLSQGFSASSDPTIQTASQTDQKSYSTSLGASYSFNDKMSLNSSFSQNISDLDGNSLSLTNVPGSFTNLDGGSRQWSITESLNYEFWPRLNAGVNASFGYVNVDSGSDQINASASGNVNWRATDKTSFQVNAGVQDSRSLGDGSGDIISPTFGATIQYQIFEPTQLSLNASRAITTSFFQNQDSDSTSVSIGLNQRLFRKYNLSLNGAYSTTDYIQLVPANGASGSGTSTVRTDDSYSFGASLSRPILKRGTISVTYSYSENRSSVTGFTYSSNQIGVQIGYSY
jgi:Putative beta-barrel porin 2